MTETATLRPFPPPPFFILSSARDNASYKVHIITFRLKIFTLCPLPLPPLPTVQRECIIAYGLKTVPLCPFSFPLPFYPLLCRLLCGAASSFSSLSLCPLLPPSRFCCYGAAVFFFCVPGTAGVGSEPTCVLAVFIPLGRDAVFYPHRLSHAGFRSLWGRRFQGTVPMLHRYRWSIGDGLDY